MTRAHIAAKIAKLQGYKMDLDTGVLYGQRGQVMKTPVDRAGYPYFSIRHPGERDDKGRLRSTRLHLHKFAAYLLWSNEAFAEGVEVRHLNDIPTENTRANLALGSSSANKMDRPHAVRLRISRAATRARRKQAA